MILLRSLLFNVAFYGWTAIICIVLLWTLPFPRPVLMRLIHSYLRSVSWMERALAGLEYEVRGREHIPPHGSFIVAAKHQSAWETMKLHLIFNDPAVVLKRELMNIPLWGRLAAKAEMIPVDRGAGGRALASMIKNAIPVMEQERPIVIFPQGTRTAPGAYKSYRIGVGVLYDRLELPILPVALNSGLYWARNSFIKRPGRIVVEILPPIMPGLDRDAAMRELETRLEDATDRLVVAAGGPPTVRPPAGPEAAAPAAG